MPIDPTISLGVTAPQMGAAGNPLGMLGAFANIQNALNQNRLFQQTFQARQAIGQMMAGSPDINTAMDKVMASPYAPFATEMFGQIRQYQNTMTDIGSKNLAMSQSILGNFGKSLATFRQNPSSSMWNSLVSQSLAVTPENLRPQVAGAMQSIGKSIMTGVDPQSDPNWRDKLDTNMAGTLTAAGIAPEQLRALTGVMAPHVVQVTGAQGQPVSSVVGGPAMGGGALGQGTSPSGGQTGPSTALGGGPTGLTPLAVGPTATRLAEMQATGKAGGDINQDMISDANELPGMIKRLDIMQNALTQFQAGGGAEVRMKVAQTFQALGASESTVNAIGNQSLSATQVFNAEMKPFAINLLKQSAQGTGRVMRSEVDQFLDMLSAAKDPNAIMRILNQARYSMQVGYDRSQKFMSYKQAIVKGDPSVAGLDLADFPIWYNKQLSASLPTQTGGGLQIGPVPMTGVLGAAASKTNALGAAPTRSGGGPPNPADYGFSR